MQSRWLDVLLVSSCLWQLSLCLSVSWWSVYWIPVCWQLFLCNPVLRLDLVLCQIDNSWGCILRESVNVHKYLVAGGRGCALTTLQQQPMEAGLLIKCQQGGLSDLHTGCVMTQIGTLLLFSAQHYFYLASWILYTVTRVFILKLGQENSWFLRTVESYKIFITGTFLRKDIYRLNKPQNTLLR